MAFAVCQAYGGQVQLHSPSALQDRSIQQARFRESALELLKRPNANFDWDQAMVLCKLYDFKAGVLFLYERNRMYALA